MTQRSYASLHRKMIREKAERDAEELGAAECRKRLAEWAAQPGRTEAEIAQLNGIVDIPRKLDS